jgi:DNA-directed RNA polymerase subunit RPC12/RpoP
MSDFRFSCPRCGQKFQGEERYAGKQMLCPGCQHLMMVPPLKSGTAPGSASPEPEQASRNVSSGSTAGKK